MRDTIVNFATIIAFIIACADLVIQIRHLNKRKSSHDISLLGAAMRFFAVNILLVKYSLLKDPYLMIGQGAFNTLLGIYTYQIIKYQKTTNNKRKRRR